MLKTATLLATAVPLENWVPNDAYKYLLAKVTDSQKILPLDKYIPFDWAFGEISTGNEGIKLSWNKAIPSKKESVRLRITSATDVREIVVLEVKTAISGKKIADWDLRFAAMLQPFELPIPSEYLKIVFTEGITIKMVKGTKPFWFFTENNSSKTAPKAYLPHLLVCAKIAKGKIDSTVLIFSTVFTLFKLQYTKLFWPKYKSNCFAKTVFA